MRRQSCFRAIWSTTPTVRRCAFSAREIWPRLRERWPGLVWRLVGKNPEAVQQFTAGDPRIEVHGQVDDAVAELARARVAVVPLLAGSGTRFKILEAWAAGLPVVSTPFGAEGLPVRDGEHLLLADSAAAFAEAVSRLLACRELRESLGTAGRLLLEKEFTWEARGRSWTFNTALSHYAPLYWYGQCASPLMLTPSAATSLGMRYTFGVC